METPEIFESKQQDTDLLKAVEKIRAELNKIIVGQDDMIDLMIIALFSQGHVLIEGVPGVAKTLTSKLIAKTINTDFSRIQFTPDLMPSDLIGTSIFNLKFSEFEFKKGPIFSNIILVDEINRSPAKTQAALFEVMEERQITVDGISYPMLTPYMIIATQNPIDHEGTFRLPEAQLDRFMFKIVVGYPGKEHEIEMLKEFHKRKNKNEVKMIEPVVSALEVINFQKHIKSLHIDDNLIAYISEIIHQTRNTKALYLGASPRAAIAILASAKANAAINGRDFVTPEDIQFVAYPSLRHRIILTAEKEMEGLTTDDIIKQIIQKIEVPR